MAFNFEKLEVYQEAVEFTNELYNLAKKFPPDEVYGLTAQLRRAGVSIALNIAEGSGRLKKEFRQFLRAARTSIYECIAILQISLRQKYLSIEEYELFDAKGDLLAKRINALIKSIG